MIKNIIKIISSTFLFFVLVAGSAYDLFGHLAVIKHPVVDMNNSFPPPNNPSASSDVKGCLRAHQGLYNEQIDCLEEREDCVKISYHNIVYGFDAETKKALGSFWVYKKHIIALQELADRDLAQAIPHPEYAQEPTIVLIFPWQHYSLGTRFKHLPNYDTKTAYAIVRADYTDNKIVLDYVPHEHALVEAKQDPQAARQLFVAIINDLVDRVAESGNDNVIPYVWGGSSFIDPYTQTDFHQKDGNWHRSVNTSPYTGYDCSEFVMRMAKIAGIEFPWKTTWVMQCSKRALAQTDQLEDGDIIWVKGHVMIVSNIDRNEIIESRGYGAGYGCVHRIPLAEIFEGIATYDDLLERYYAKQSLSIKNRNGDVEKYDVFKLLKLT